jgi:hypothetical protein
MINKIYNIQYRTIKKKINNDLILNDFTNQIIIGVLLGDSRVDKQKINYNARLCFEQGELHKDYLFHLFDVFKPFCGVTEPSFRTKFHKINNNYNNSYLFKTLSYPCFNYYYDLFYLNKIKVVPSNIQQLLTPIGLAYWAMDDGSKKDSGFIFCTHSFSLNHVELLSEILFLNFNIESNIHKARLNQYVIYIKSNSISHFKLLVQPYFHPSMLYKLS